MKKILLATTVITLSILANSAQAGFAANHPRRAEVNTREARQEARINAGVAQGTISSTQAAQLQADEARIKAQEVSEVQANGGYLTKSQKQQLNTELNTESQDIYGERHPSSASTGISVDGQ